MTKIEKLYCQYQLCNKEEQSLFFWTIKTVDAKTYYQLQGEIFVEMQSNLYKEIAQMLVDDCMKYFKKFSIDILDTLVDEMQFMDISDDIKNANKNRLKHLSIIKL